jgi:hypothetical protein
MGKAQQPVAAVLRVRLRRELSATECWQRNALSKKLTGYALPQDAVGTVMETFGAGEAYLVEFGTHPPDGCDWLGVLYPTEIEVVTELAAAA